MGAAARTLVAPPPTIAIRASVSRVQWPRREKKRLRLLSTSEKWPGRAAAAALVMADILGYVH